MWGTSWRQRLRLAPLAMAIAAADRLSAFAPTPRAPPARPWAPGITTIIPERDAPLMLAATLGALAAALDRVDEPRQIVVVANLKPSKLMGVESRGMLCAEKELGLSDANAGLMELAADAPVGADLRRYLGLDDKVIEIGLTPNRARDKLNELVEAGKMTCRHYRDGQRAFKLYRVAVQVVPTYDEGITKFDKWLDGDD